VLAKSITNQGSGDLSLGTPGKDVFIAYSREPNCPPITGLSVFFPGLGETAPEGFRVIEKTPAGEDASLNSGNNGSDVYLCFQRDPNAPPITGLAVVNMKELQTKKTLQSPIEVDRIRWNDHTLLEVSPQGHKANLNRKVKNASPIYLAYRGGSKSYFGYPKPPVTEGKGLLRVHLIEARNLKAADIGGTSDPYCDFHIGDPKAKGSKKKTSSIIDKTLNPFWNESFLFRVDQNDILTIKCYDHDNVGRDDPLGQIQVKLDTLVQGKEIEQWIPLQHVKQGDLHLKFIALDFGLPPDSEPTALRPIVSEKDKNMREELSGLIFRNDSAQSAVHDFYEKQERFNALEKGTSFVSKTGHLEKFPTKTAMMGISLNQGWKKRYFSLEKHRLKYYRSSKDISSSGAPLGSISLKGAHLELSREHDLVFHVNTKTKNLEIRAANEQDLEAWYQAIGTNIALASKIRNSLETSAVETSVAETSVGEASLETSAGETAASE